MRSWRCTLLLSSSDWAFMVTRESAAEYAWQRARTHAERFSSLADLLQAGASSAGPASELATSLRALDGPFGHLDARTF